MQAMSKSRDIDIISGLPEDVILHILSFISTRQAVQMSLLSKRWRHLWTRTPVLFFNGFEFRKFRHVKNIPFHNFTNQVLFLGREGEGIRKFHFTAYFVYVSRVRKWIINVARHRNVEELVIEIRFNVHRPQKTKKNELPLCLSSCQSLQVLKLKFWTGCPLKLPNYLNFSRLNSLHLRAITTEGDSLGKLISSCYFLEDLYLESCQFDSLIISGNNHKKLSILYCCELKISKIKVSVPSLLSFDYRPLFKQQCSLDNLVSLVEARILICDLGCLSEGIITMCEIIKGIRYASSVCMAYFGDEHLCLPQELVECLPVFNNLTRLDLNIWLNNDHLEAIINILERSPNLKTLSLHKLGPLAPEEEDSSWTPKEISPPFLLHLEKIKLKSAQSSSLHLEFVNFLLRNTNSVKEITIIPYATKFGGGKRDS